MERVPIALIGTLVAIGVTFFLALIAGLLLLRRPPASRRVRIASMIWLALVAVSIPTLLGIGGYKYYSHLQTGLGRLSDGPGPTMLLADVDMSQVTWPADPSSPTSLLLRIELLAQLHRCGFHTLKEGVADNISRTVEHKAACDLKCSQARALAAGTRYFLTTTVLPDPADVLQHRGTAVVYETKSTHEVGRMRFHGESPTALIADLRRTRWNCGGIRPPAPLGDACPVPKAADTKDGGAPTRLTGSSHQ